MYDEIMAAVSYDELEKLGFGYGPVAAIGGLGGGVIGAAGGAALAKGDPEKRKKYMLRGALGGAALGAGAGYGGARLLGAPVSVASGAASRAGTSATGAIRSAKPAVGGLHNSLWAS